MVPDNKLIPKEQATSIWQYYTASLRKHLANPGPLDPMAAIYKDHLQLTLNSIKLAKVLEYQLIDEFLHRNSFVLARSFAQPCNLLSHR